MLNSQFGQPYCCPSPTIPLAKDGTDSTKMYRWSVEENMRKGDVAGEGGLRIGSHWPERDFISSNQLF